MVGCGFQLFFLVELIAKCNGKKTSDDAIRRIIVVVILGSSVIDDCSFPANHGTKALSD